MPKTAIIKERKLSDTALFCVLHILIYHYVDKQYINRQITEPIVKTFRFPHSVQ